ncbi:MAG: YigZ family protein [Myxococcota bacterium]|jgi:putative IMPACT (imprinted ancient) family translation regulator|nr:YigZ family protein [Myxococcota bacterium]
MWTLAQPARHEEIVKRSRFMAQAAPCASPAAALAFRDEVQDAGANHNAWAYKLGAVYRFGDDGEVAGTAGRPILAAIEGQGLDLVVVVVTRWFGGIKLGAGGLTRAYGGVAAECLRRAERLEVLPQVELRAGVPFAHVADLYRLVERCGGTRGEETYSLTGLELELILEQRRLAEFTRLLADATRGQATIEPSE